MDQAMARHLFDRLADTVSLQYLRPAPGEVAPMPNRCHDNAAAWVKAHPTWTVVHGWLPFGDTVGGAFFDAHSVVRDPAGTLWDITQTEFDRLIIFTGDPATFLGHIETRAWVRLTHIPNF
jgi:hypothetical protein